MSIISDLTLIIHFDKRSKIELTGGRRTALGCLASKKYLLEIFFSDATSKNAAADKLSVEMTSTH